MNATVRTSRFDALLVVALLTACELELVLHELDRRPRSYPLLVVGISATAAMTVALWWRRRAPLVTTGAAMVGLVVLVVAVRGDTSMLNVPQLLLFVIPYSVAIYAERASAWWGLAVCLVAVSAANLVTSADGGSWMFSIGACSAAWCVGRYMRTQRSLAAELERTSAQIVAETEGRERLAVAEQRTRIARELQTLVADNVSTMIVHAQAAQRLLEIDRVQADDAMEAIEETGRSALIEMRLILGVLHRANQPADLAPQPGVGQISVLVDEARVQQRHIALQVTGDPGPLPASVDLGVYRILQDVLALGDDTDLDVAVTFASDHIDLRVHSHRPIPAWPSVAVRERVMLCEGELSVDAAGMEQTLIVRLPTELRGALA